MSAGSVLRVRPAAGADPDAVLSALARLSITGLGELTAQGFGRVVIGHEFLDQREIRLARLRRTDFLRTDLLDDRGAEGDTQEER